MAELPAPVAAFLRGKRFAVAGVSRTPKGVANAIFKKLRDAGYEVVPINPNAAEVEGARCYPEVTAVPGAIDGVVIATAPGTALAIVRQCSEKGVKHVWFHRALGEGSVSKEAIAECRTHGIAVIENGCPMMYVEPVDGGHQCIRWWLGLFGKVPR